MPKRLYMLKESTQEKLDFIQVNPKLKPHVSYNITPRVQLTG